MGYIDDGNGNCTCPEGKEDNGSSCVEKTPDPEPTPNPEENNG